MVGTDVVACVGTAMLWAWSRYLVYALTVGFVAAWAYSLYLADKAGYWSLYSASQIAQQIKRWDLLHLALLLHDVGKGYGRGHALRGGQIAQRVGDRFRLPPADVETVRFLVLSHLKLSHAAQRRDLSDPKVAQQLAKEIGTLDRLKMLYVHSVCDLMAVSPEAWNDWKAQLLAECYMRTAEVLGVERSNLYRKMRAFGIMPARRGEDEETV